MAVFLGAAAMIVNDPAFFLASISLVFLSAALAIRFRQRMHRVVTSARITRIADRKIVHQGGSTAVTTRFFCQPDPAISLRVSEVTPTSVLADSSDTSAIVAPDGTATIQYSITPILPGKIRIPGIMLTVSDSFFTASLFMGSDPFCGPQLDVQPSSEYGRSGARESEGSKEKDSLSIYRGLGIRSIREYTYGDDLRSVDWKMTAKHNRLFIREYSAIENLPPLIVLDLPDRLVPIPDEQMAKLINAVTTEVATAMRNYGSVSLFIISGANTIDIVLEETDLMRCLSVIRKSAHPCFRLNQAYRWKDRARMRAFVRKQDSMLTCPDKDETDAFRLKLAWIYRKSLTNPYTPIFSTQVIRLFKSLEINNIILFSFFDGDLSHIREIALQAQVLRIRITPKTVTRDTQKTIPLRKALDTDTLEVIP
jgi:uncharacterized protein (DUF58 family)